MGASLQKSNNHRGKKRGSGYSSIAEINVTPFVDVLLVLLIVFMVTAPLINVGVPVNLPKTNAPLVHESEEPLTVSITKEGKVFIQETEVTEDALATRLEIITKQNKQVKIYIKGDKTRSYGDVMRVMGLIYGAGFTKVMLLGEQMEDKNKPVKKKP